MNKPIKPNIIIPENFAQNGVKTDFDNEKLLNGFDNLQPDVLAGDNLNKFIDDTYKGLNYSIAGTDAINLIKEGETLTVVNGELVSSNIIDNIATDLNQKVDKSNMVEVPTIVEVSDPSLMPSWYRVYSDGWCEQGGICGNSADISLLKPYKDTNYIILHSVRNGTTGAGAYHMSFGIKNITTNGFHSGIGSEENNAPNQSWVTKGYIK